MPRKSERVTLKVTPSRKHRWKNYANDNPEYNGLTDLVTLSVEREINGALDRDAIEDLDLDVDLDTAALENIDDLAEEVTTRLERLDDRVADMESHVKTNDFVGRLAREIYDDLPTADTEQDLPDPDDIDDTDPYAVLAVESTPNAWAAVHEIAVDDARRALTRASELFPDVAWTTTGDGERRYYRRTPTGGR